ncbi:hypothetical protein D3C81_1964650 [compost metagenome]
MVQLPKRLFLKVKVVKGRRVLQHLPMSVIIQQEPIQLALVSPFDELPKFSSHEEELLAWTCQLISEQYTKTCKFLFIIAGHFIQQ